MPSDETSASDTQRDRAWTERLVQMLLDELERGDPVTVSHEHDVRRWVSVLDEWQRQDAERARVITEITEAVSSWGPERERQRADQDARDRRSHEAATIVALHLEVIRTLASAETALEPIRTQGMPYHLMPREAQRLPWTALAALTTLQDLHGDTCEACADARAVLRELPGGPFPVEHKPNRHFSGWSGRHDGNWREDIRQR